MDVLADFFQSTDGVDQVVGEVARVGRGKADALQAANGIDLRQQVAERNASFRHILAVGVDRLPEQRHLFRAAARQPLDLRQDLRSSGGCARGPA